MLSPTLPVPASEGSSAPEQSTRRRGLSYLRSLSSHSSAANSDQSRVSPRNFFQRSTSYNENSKNKPNSGRRRSTSKPDEPTNLPVERQSLPITRVLSADNPAAAIVENRRLIQESGEGSIQEAEQSSPDPEDMARTVSGGSRRATEGAATAARPAIGARGAASHNDVSATNNVNGTDGPDTANGTDEPKARAPTIRLFPHHELRNGRQSLNFSPVSRTLPQEGSIIRVGRYSEREGLPIAMPSTPSDAPVGFKSKVVSRKHCEFCFVDGQWHIKDVASSSGTFLNHIRLSQPNQESRLFPIKDGDIVQLGIDFRGGEEMIFRCVKIRIECNRSWQKKPNTFNKTRRAQLLGLTKDQPAAGQNSGECAICLGSVLPCQSLFVAPCAHVWHYKCIRPMLEGRQSHYPQFQCPNCRAWADLEADVDVAEEDMEEWMENEENTDENVEADQTDRTDTAEPPSGADNSDMDVDTVAHSSKQTSAAPPTANGLLARRTANSGEASEVTAMSGIDMPARPSQDEMEQHLAQQQTRTESPNSDQIMGGEGPLTPRNNAGPFVFDGSGESGGTRRLTVPTLPEITEGRQL